MLTDLDISRLSYFDILAIIGNGSLHWGGQEATYELLSRAKARTRSKILEVGCGPGVTSSSLLACGVDLTIVEPSQTMVKASLNRCARNVKKLPAVFPGKIEDVGEFLPKNYYDIVLIECVFGFIEDKIRATEIFSDSLRSGGIMAVLDFYYVEPPPRIVSEKLSKIGINDLLYKEDWLNYYKKFKLMSWNETKTKNPEFSLSSIRGGLKESPFFTKVQNNESIPELLYKILCEYSSTFSENRKYMVGFSATWEKQ